MLKIMEYAEAMDKCAHCGNCQAVCPVYKAELLEPYVARSRVNLIKSIYADRSQNVTDAARDIINKCLACSNCARLCAAGVPGDEITIAARAELFEKYGSAGGKKNTLMHELFNRRGLTGLLGKAGVLAQRLNINMPGMPKLADRFFEKTYKGTLPACGEKRARVAYYVGCGTNFMFPDTGDAVVKVLTGNGIEVVLAQGLSCCGIPAMADGNLEAARKGAMNNIGILANLDVDAIVTDCTSCGLMLSERMAKLFSANDPLQEKIKLIASKTREVTDYLNDLGLRGEAPVLEGTYTYHIPCHQGWSSTVAEAPRKLLSCIQHLKLSEMEEPEACCGGGGTFYMEHPETAARIREKKLADMSVTGARWLVTQCPACRIYLSQGQREMEVIHPMNLLARASKKPDLGGSQR